MKKLCLILSLALIVISCKSPSPKMEEEGQSYDLKHAKQFSVDIHPDYKVLKVMNPWEAGQVLATYVLYQKDNKPKELPQGIQVGVPVSEVACLNSTQLGFIRKLNKIESITGVSTAKYFKDSTLHKGIESGYVIDFGPGESLEMEKLIGLNPDILFVPPFKNNKYAQIQESGIPVAISSSYHENSPLGRAEWIKFIAFFYEQEELAKEIFDAIESKYLDLKAKTSKISDRPTVFNGKTYGNVWYVSGIDSYMAQLFTDAGAQYIWKDKKYTGSEPLEFETVYARAADTEFWFLLEYFPGEYSHDNLIGENENYGNFNAFQNKNVWLCNTFFKAYYEKGITEPEVLLKDMINIFHPGILQDTSIYYYHQLP